MSQRPSTFKKIDIKRLVEAAAMAGIEIGAIEISKAGDLRLTPKSSAAAPSAAQDAATVVQDRIEAMQRAS
jgi:hypothetical protein